MFHTINIRCFFCNLRTRDESGMDIIRPTERVRHSNGKTVFESGHFISVTIRTALVSGNSLLNFYDPNMMNVTIQQKIYCPYPYSIREFFPRKKNYLYLCPQYPSVSDPFSSLLRTILKTSFFFGTKCTCDTHVFWKKLKLMMKYSNYFKKIKLLYTPIPHTLLWRSI
jgi:hypothetical protein